MRIAIKNDVFDVAERIRSIDARYRVFFDTEKQKFVVTAGDRTAVVLPFESLDCRTLDYLYFTRYENADEVIKTIDGDNERMQVEAVKKAQDRLEDDFSHEMRTIRSEIVSGSLPSSEKTEVKQ